MKYIIIILLVLFLIYMVAWTYNLYIHTSRQNKLNRINELKAKREAKENNGKEDAEDKKIGNSEGVTDTVDDKKETGKKGVFGKAAVKKDTEEVKVEDTRDYWLNKQELEQCETDKEKAECYHYFDSVEEGFRGLLLEIYDCGLVRIDELENIAYGENRFDNMDMSFLEELDKDDDVITVLGGADRVIVDAAKKLDKNDPGITDIKGTLSDGVENVLKAVDEEKQKEEKKNEPISKKEEVSVEKARYDRARTSSQEIRNKIFLKWDGYVSDLYDIIEIKASKETKHKIKKALRDYGYSDVDVLLKSPE